MGSFVNVVIYRLPRGESLARPGSRCPGCGEPIPAWANVPLLSWLALRGRCHHCGSRIAWRYPLVEAATAMLFVALWRHSLEPHDDAPLEVDAYLKTHLDFLMAALKAPGKS